MIRIEEPIYFYLLLAIPLLVLIFYFYYQYAERLHSYFVSKVADKDRAQKQVRSTFICFGLGIAFLLLSMTNPQYGYRKENVKRESADVFIAVDISQSMMAEDLSPSRLERAKKIGERLISEIKTERIGLIFFAGEAYLQMPLTTDYKTALVFLNNASVDQAGTQGTAIGEAIKLAAKREEDDLSNIERVLIVITDGEDHEGEFAEQAKLAYDQGTTIFTVGIGTEEGAFIPVKHGGKDDYMRDNTGQPVRSKLNVQDLQAIAKQGGGLYFDHQAGSSMFKEVKEKVRRMERRHFEKTLFTARESYFQWLILPGILLMSFPFVWPLLKHMRKQPKEQL